MNCFIHFEFSKTKANNTDFRTGKPVNTAPDWTGHMTSSANHYDNPGPKPVLFVSKATIKIIIWKLIRTGFPAI